MLTQKEVINQFIGSRDWDEPITSTSYDRRSHCDSGTLYAGLPPVGGMVASWWNDRLCIIYNPTSSLGKRLAQEVANRGILWTTDEETAELVYPAHTIHA